VFSVDDRIGLVSDASALAGAGFTKTSAALEMIHQLRDEPHCESSAPAARNVLRTVIQTLSGSRSQTLWVRSNPLGMRTRWSATGWAISDEWVVFRVKLLRAAMLNMMQSLYAPLVKKLGYEFPAGEDTDVALLRKRAIGGAAAGNDPE
jgi:aminopeptidase 2